MKNHPRLRSLTLALGLAVSLVSCGTTQWQKSGADEAAVTKDLMACGSASQDRISRLYGAPLPSTGMSDPRFGPDQTRLSPAERGLEEQQLTERCMRERGYALAPATGKK
jgi:hypothetical protein